MKILDEKLAIKLLKYYVEIISGELDTNYSYDDPAYKKAIKTIAEQKDIINDCKKRIYEEINRE